MQLFAAKGSREQPKTAQNRHKAAFLLGAKMKKPESTASQWILGLKKMEYRDSIDAAAS